MTRKTGRKEYVCKRCKRIIEKGTMHEVVEDYRFGYGNGNTVGVYNKPSRYHDDCFKMETEDAINRTVDKWSKELEKGNDPFKWCH